MGMLTLKFKMLTLKFNLFNRNSNSTMQKLLVHSCERHQFLYIEFSVKWECITLRQRLSLSVSASGRTQDNRVAFIEFVGTWKTWLRGTLSTGTRRPNWGEHRKGWQNIHVDYIADAAKLKIVWSNFSGASPRTPIFHLTLFHRGQAPELPECEYPTLPYLTLPSENIGLGG